MSMRLLLLLRPLVWFAAFVSLCADAGSARALPQCEDDAGSVTCEDDAGAVTPPVTDAGVPADAGMSRDDAGSRPPTGGSGSGRACSCESELDDDGRIHVCTESDDPQVCRAFDCDLGTRLDRPCPSAPTRLCCEMPARDLQSYLYEDCTHPNCESGFREQCREFGGSVYRGACERPAVGGSTGDRIDDDDGSVCSTAFAGADGPRGAGWLTLCGAIALLLRRRRVARRA
jgi:hypothetical protein